MNEYAFQFAVLRYVHDPMTQEFLNVGVVVYAREVRYVRARISHKYQRLSNAFVGFEGDHYRRIARYLERRLEKVHGTLQQLDMFEETPAQIEILLAQVLPPDDSSLVFAGFGGGVAEDLDEELTWLYERLVERYVEREESPSRDDDEVWQVFREPLDRREVTPRLSTNVTIRAARYNYHYKFSHAWKNERWHPLQAVSFDLMEARSIREKANTWIGRSISLEDSKEIGTLYLLVGEPRHPELQGAYRQAVKALTEQIALKHQVIEEREAETFSEMLAQQIQIHEEGE